MRIALLIALPMFLAGATQTGGPPTTAIDVRLSNFRFTPNVIRLTHGQVYVLRFANDAGGGHDFFAKEFFAAASLDTRTRKIVAKGGVEITGDGTVEMRLIAPGPGRYKVKCTHFLHAGFGMKGEIVVD